MAALLAAVDFHLPDHAFDYITHPCTARKNPDRDAATRKSPGSVRLRPLLFLELERLRR
jgi:hypothetical protein